MEHLLDTTISGRLAGDLAAAAFLIDRVAPDSNRADHVPPMLAAHLPDALPALDHDVLQGVVDALHAGCLLGGALGVRAPAWLRRRIGASPRLSRTGDPRADAVEAMWFMLWAIGGAQWAMRESREARAMPPALQVGWLRWQVHTSLEDFGDAALAPLGELVGAVVAALGAHERPAA